MRIRVPKLVPVAAVAALLAGSLATLWGAGEALARRDRQRAEATRRLVRAEGALSRAGAAALAFVPEWPATLDPSEWRALDRWLATEAERALAEFPGTEGGFFVPAADRFLGRAREESGPDTSDPPAAERALIETQVAQTLDRDEPLSIVVETPPHALALRTVPVWVNGRQVAATWTLARLDEATPIASTIRGYRVAAALALGGVVLALVIALGLWRTVRRQARERSRLEADLRRSERLAALGKLLAGVAHEVRNPLAGIRSTAQLWQRGLPPEADAIADLVAEVDRLDAIVARLLTFSRAEATAMAPGDLNAVVAEAARLAGPIAEPQGVRVELHPTDGPLPVRMSPPGLLQLLRNLTANALQAMPDGGTLRLETARDPHGGAVVRVIDTGPGLTDEVMTHLFEPFYTTRPDGTGLGLAIAREIALAHGGELRADNRRDGPGAEFTLALPAAKEAPVEPLLA